MTPYDSSTNLHRLYNNLHRLYNNSTPPMRMKQPVLVYYELVEQFVLNHTHTKVDIDPLFVEDQFNAGRTEEECGKAILSNLNPLE